MFVANEHIVWRENEGKFVLLNSSNGHYYTVNATGSFLWKCMIENQMSLDEAIKQIHTRFDNLPEPQTIKEDFTQMLEKWKLESLIQIKP